MKELLDQLKRASIKIGEARTRIQEAIKEWNSALRDIQETQRKLRQFLSRPSD